MIFQKRSIRPEPEKLLLPTSRKDRMDTHKNAAVLCLVEKRWCDGWLRI